MNVSEAVKKFLTWVKRNRSSRTHGTYSERIRRLPECLGHRQLSRLRQSEIEDYLDVASRRKDGRLLAADTRRLNVVVLQQFQKWALNGGHIKKRIFESLEMPKGRLRQQLPTEDEQKAILNVASAEFQRLYIALMITGAKPSELVAADIEDYDRENNLILLPFRETRRKRPEPRKIGVGRIVKKIIELEMDGRKSGPIFRDEKQERWRANQLSARYRRYRDKAGLRTELVLYSATRHEHGVRMTRKLGLQAAAHSMGSSIESVKRYVRLDDADLSNYQDVVFEG